MNTNPSGIVQFQLSPECVLYGLADDGKIYYWDKKNVWIPATDNLFKQKEFP